MSSEFRGETQVLNEVQAEYSQGKTSLQDLVGKDQDVQEALVNSWHAKRDMTQPLSSLLLAFGHGCGCWV